MNPLFFKGRERKKGVVGVEPLTNELVCSCFSSRSHSVFVSLIRLIERKGICKWGFVSVPLSAPAPAVEALLSSSNNYINDRHWNKEHIAAYSNTTQSAAAIVSISSTLVIIINVLTLWLSLFACL